MSTIKHFINVISLIFVLSFIYLIILWTFFRQSMPQHEIYFFRIMFSILIVWMIAVTLIGILKMIKYFYSYILHIIKKI